MTVPDDVRPAPDADDGGQSLPAQPDPHEPPAAQPDPRQPPAAQPDPHQPPAAQPHPHQPPPAQPDPHQPLPAPDAGSAPCMDGTSIAVPGDECDIDTAEVEHVAAEPVPAEPVPAEPVPAEPVPAEPVPAEPVLDVEFAEVLAALTSLGATVDGLAATTAELVRLRTRDTDLISRLHDDVTTLRTGEIAAAMNPVVAGMIKLHDQMVSLGGLTDSASPVGMLYTQLLQMMELTCGVKPFTPSRGERFDASRHTGARRIATADASADGTIADTIKAGFVRADGSVVRVAEVEVHRLSA